MKLNTIFIYKNISYTFFLYCAHKIKIVSQTEVDKSL